MSDGRRDPDDAVANTEPPLDQSAQVLQREAQLAPAPRLGRAPRRRLTLALASLGCIAAIVLLAAVAHSRNLTEKPAKPIAPHPCAVGTKSCGPLPRVPTNGLGSYDFARPSPRVGPLRAGSYSSAANQTGIHIGFTVPAGWRWNGRTLSKGNAAVSFYASPVLVYTDPCHWNQPQHPPVKPALASSDVILSELAAQPLRYASRPILFPPNSQPDDAVAIRLTVPSNLDLSHCDHGQYRTWGVGRNTLRADGPGQRDLIWITTLGFFPKKLIVDATTFPTTPTHLVDQVDAILAELGACGSCG